MAASNGVGYMITLTDAEYDGIKARIAALEAENERLLSLCQQWSEGCTGRHGSQSQCVDSSALETDADPNCQHDLLLSGCTIKVTDNGKRATCFECEQVWYMPPTAPEPRDES